MTSGKKWRYLISNIINYNLFNHFYSKSLFTILRTYKIQKISCISLSKWHLGGNFFFFYIFSLFLIFSLKHKAADQEWNLKINDLYVGNHSNNKNKVLVTICWVKYRIISKKFKKPTHRILNGRYLSNPISKFPCQPSLPSQSYLSFSRIPTLASLL